MKQLLPTEIGEFSARFSHFDDGLLRSLNCRWKASSLEVELEISTRDQSLEWDWINVKLKFASVESYVFAHEPSAYFILSNGVHIEVFDELFCFELGYLCDAPDSIEKTRESKQHVIAREVSWQVTPYRE